MASIGNDKNGLRRILFVCPREGTRKTIRLGKVSKKAAASFCTKIESLIESNITGQPLDADVSRWLTDLPDVLRDRLAAVGLLHRREAVRLGDFTRHYIDGRTDLKPASRSKLENARDAMLGFFDPQTLVRQLSAGDAEDWRKTLIQKGLSKATVQKYAAIAKQMMGDAKKRNLIDDDPFSELPSAAVATKNKRVVSDDEAVKVLAACPNAQWRLLFALARFAGLRTPSESHLLTWADIDWDQRRMTVRSPKTEHHEGHAERIVPIFPKLMPYLQAAFDEAEPGVAHVVTLICGDLHRAMLRIVHRAGVEKWSKPFHTLRASCQTELCMTYPDYAVAKWLGNSVRVAERHYLRMTDDLMNAAAGITSEPNKAAQNAAQQGAEMGRSDEKGRDDGERSNEREDAELPVNSSTCESLQDGRTRTRIQDHRLSMPSAFFVGVHLRKAGKQEETWFCPCWFFLGRNFGKVISVRLTQSRKDAEE